MSRLRRANHSSPEMSLEIDKKVLNPYHDVEKLNYDVFLLAKQLLADTPIAQSNHNTFTLVKCIMNGEFDDISPPNEAGYHWDQWLNRVRSIMLDKGLVVSRLRRRGRF